MAFTTAPYTAYWVVYGKPQHSSMHLDVASLVQDLLRLAQNNLMVPSMKMASTVHQAVK